MLVWGVRIPVLPQSRERVYNNHNLFYTQLDTDWLMTVTQQGHLTCHIQMFKNSSKSLNMNQNDQNFVQPSNKQPKKQCPRSKAATTFSVKRWMTKNFKIFRKNFLTLYLNRSDVFYLFRDLVVSSTIPQMLSKDTIWDGQVVLCHISSVEKNGKSAKVSPVEPRFHLPIIVFIYGVVIKILEKSWCSNNNSFLLEKIFGLLLPFFEVTRVQGSLANPCAMAYWNPDWLKQFWGC